MHDDSSFFEERDGANESLGAKLTDWTRKNILGKREYTSLVLSFIVECGRKPLEVSEVRRLRLRDPT